MKKHIIALTAIATLSVGAAGQVSASSVHTVEKGDTLWSISQAENVSVQDLQQWNDLNTTVIYPSQQLKVEEGLETYTVVSGDTLFNIAKDHNITVEQLKANNHLTSDLIIPGDKLIIEGSKVIKSQVSTATATTTPAVSNAPETKPTTAAKELTMTSTAYTASCAGCSGITATGINLKANPNQKVISVDPSVIPLGSKVWVEGYGEAIAGDTGGAIKGNKIDIFIPSKQEAINWGRKTVKVKILN